MLLCYKENHDYNKTDVLIFPTKKCFICQREEPQLIPSVLEMTHYIRFGITETLQQHSNIMHYE